MQKTFNPEFSALMALYRDAAPGVGHDHQHSRRLWLLIGRTAPAWFKAEMMSIAREMDLSPTPRQCNNQGEAILTSTDLTLLLGMSNEKAQAAFEALIADRKAQGLPTEGITRASGDNLHGWH